MTRYLILIFIALTLLSACSEDIQESTTSASTQEKTKNLNAKEIMQNKDVKYSINESGIVIFKNAHDMINTFNDYAQTTKFNSDYDFVITIDCSQNDSENDKLILIRKAFLYGIYQTFAHTNAKEVSIEVRAMDSQTHHLQNKIKATVSRDKALTLLRHYFKSDSFNDLVELSDNDEFRVKGYSSSLLFDKLISDLTTQRQIVLALIN